MSRAEILVSQVRAPEAQAAIHRSGLGNNELAELMGVAPSTVSRWMYGTHAPAPHRLLELDKILKSRGVDLLHNVS